MINDYKPIANGVGANVETQLAYETDLGPGGVLQNGYLSGVAPSNKVNKTVRQSSVVSAAFAQAIGDILAVDMLDDGDVVTLTARIKAAILNGAWTTGDVKLTIKVVPDAGWLMCDDGTVGSTASTATHNSDLNKALFLFIWNTVSDTWAPVVTGRGGSALLDWNANKKITMTKMLGRALAIAGAGSALTPRALGQILGNETHVLTQAETPIRDHAHPIGTVALCQSGGAGRVLGPGGATNTDSTGLAGDPAAAAHDIMNPSSYLNAMIKL